MIHAGRPMVRFRGGGEHLRLRVTKAQDPLSTVRECCRASTALEKALGEAVRDALAAGHDWAELGESLGVKATKAEAVLEQYEASRQWMRRRFWGMEGKGS